MRIKPVAMTVDGLGVSHSKTVVHVGGHRIVMDEPPHRDGTDEGPPPVDMMVASLAGCTTVILNKIAHEKGVKISSLEIKLSGDLDVRGILGHELVQQPISRLSMQVAVKADIDAQVLKTLTDELRWRCPVGVILRSAGIDIEEEWSVVPVE